MGQTPRVRRLGGLRGFRRASGGSGSSNRNCRIPGKSSPSNTRMRRSPSVAVSFCVAPPRFTSSGTARPAGVSPTSRDSCAALRTASPSKRTMTSSCLIPAFSAGLPDSTERTFAPRASPATSSSPIPRKPLPPACRTITRFSTFGPSPASCAARTAGPSASAESATAKTPSATATVRFIAPPSCPASPL